MSKLLILLQDFSNDVCWAITEVEIAQIKFSCVLNFVIFLNFVKKATHLLFWRINLQILCFCHIQASHQLILNAFDLGHIWCFKDPCRHILYCSVRSDTTISSMNPFWLWTITSSQTTFLLAHLIQNDGFHFLFQRKFVRFWNIKRVWLAKSERNFGVWVVKFGGCFFGVWRHKAVFNERVWRNLRSPATFFAPLIWTFLRFRTYKRRRILICFCLLKF